MTDRDAPTPPTPPRTSAVGVVEAPAARSAHPAPGRHRGTEASVRSAARNGAVGIVGAGTAAALGLLLTVVVARTSGAAGSGAFFSATAVATIVISLCALGADTGVLWALPRDVALSGGAKTRALLKLALIPVVAVSVVAATGFWLVAPWAASHLEGHDPADTTSLLRVLALAVLLGPMVLVLMQATRALGNLIPFVVSQQVGLPLLRVLGVLLAAALSGATLARLGLAWSLPLILAALYVSLVVRRRVRTMERRHGVDAERRTASDRKEFWRFSLVRGLGQACQLSLVWLDVVLVAILTSTAEAGIYAVASRFATSGQLALQAMRLSTAPELSAAFARRDEEGVRQLYAMSTTWAVLLSWPLFVTLIAFAPWLMRFFGADFRAGVIPLVIVCSAMMFSVAMGNVGTVLLMSGNSAWSTATTAIALAVDVALVLLLVPHLGATGAAIAWLVSIVANNTIGLWMIRRKLHLRLRRRGNTTHALVCLAIPAAAAGAAYALLGATTPGVLLHLALVVPLMAAYCWLRRDFLRIELLPVGRLVRRLPATRSR